MAKSKPLTKEQNDANLAAIKKAQSKTPASHAATQSTDPGKLIKCTACNREYPAGTDMCVCGAHMSLQQR